MKVAVIGGGSWGTAIAKLLTCNLSKVNWWVRQPETVRYIKKHHRNPNYLSYAEFEPDKLVLSTDLQKIIQSSDILIFAIPAAFLKQTLSENHIKSLKSKIVVSAIKGIVPEDKLVVGDFLLKYHEVEENNFGVIAGPCHSEEVAMQKLSFLTVSFKDFEKAILIQQLLSTWFMKITPSNDVKGAEFSAVLKNIVAIANGIAIGVGYGDNFQAVLISNSIQEVNRILDKIYPMHRNIIESVYMGDIIVTAYSKFSRNRMFGNYIGRGYSVKSTMAEMKMVAEGYYAVKSLIEMNKELKLHIPIMQMVYNIIYKKSNPETEMRLLEKKIS